MNDRWPREIGKHAGQIKNIATAESYGNVPDFSSLSFVVNLPWVELSIGSTAVIVS